jgi:hypothetical protein
MDLGKLMGITTPATLRAVVEGALPEFLALAAATERAVGEGV